MLNSLRNFRASKGFKKYFFNTSWLVLEKVAKFSLAIFVIPIVARYLDPDRFGILNYGLSLVGLFLPLAALGINNIVTRELVHFPEKENELMGTSFWLKLLGGVATFLMIFLVAYLFEDDAVTRTLVYVIGLTAVFQSLDIVDYFFQAKADNRDPVVVKIIVIVMSAVSRLLLVYYEAPLITFGWVAMLEIALPGIGFFIVYQFRGGNFFKWRINWSLAKPLMKDSMPLILYGGLLTLNMKIDQVMISHLIGYEANGMYAAVSRLVESLYFIPVAVGASFFPALINARRKDNELYKDRMLFLYEVMLAVSLFFTLFFVVSAGLIVDILYGAEYAEAISVLRIYAFAMILIFYGSIRGRWLIIENMQHHSFLFLFYSFVVNLVLNYLLIPVYGINGAAIAILISYVVAFYIVPMFFKSTRESVWMFNKAWTFYQIRKRFFSLIDYD